MWRNISGATVSNHAERVSQMLLPYPFSAQRSFALFAFIAHSIPTSP